MYPFDTLKTQIQSYSAKAATAATAPGVCPSTSTSGASAASAQANQGSKGMMCALRVHFRANSPAAAFGRLWRGSTSMAVGCVPAHAMYFSSYELVKAFFLSRQQQQQSGGGGSANLGAVGSSVAGAVAALCHDAVMVPADTVKQRMQLGYYGGTVDAFRTMVRQEGAGGLYRALPVTLCTNLPYGAVMVTTNEYLREVLMNRSGARTLDVKTTLLAGCGAGMAAAAVTTPLDRLKTRLQTQGLGVVVAVDPGGARRSATTLSGAGPNVPGGPPRYSGLSDAFRSVMREEGFAGLWRGLGPRLMTHTPSVAISWAVYESMKLWLSASPDH